jgi:hypothetical protein
MRRGSLDGPNPDCETVGAYRISEADIGVGDFVRPLSWKRKVELMLETGDISSSGSKESNILSIIAMVTEYKSDLRSSSRTQIFQQYLALGIPN